MESGNQDMKKTCIQSIMKPRYHEIEDSRNVGICKSRRQQIWTARSSNDETKKLSKTNIWKPITQDIHK